MFFIFSFLHVPGKPGVAPKWDSTCSNVAGPKGRPGGRGPAGPAPLPLVEDRDGAHASAD